ncbi:MAG: hypothetical protein HY319_18730 [Armatimonadetes bacterium]|nr:hypothetical protein [Armatimonadota bacterium]
MQQNSPQIQSIIKSAMGQAASEELLRGGKPGDWSDDWLTGAPSVIIGRW